MTRDSEENNWGFGTDDPVSMTAGRMYGAEVARVREQAASYDIGAERLRKTFEGARAEADRSSAILLFALAEDLMLSGLKQHLHGEVKGGWDELSGGNGLLATASDRITLLALLSWIHPTVYADLRVLKTIRNRFAHHPDVIGFDEQKIRSQISALTPIEKALLQKMAVGADTATPISNFIRPAILPRRSRTSSGAAERSHPGASSSPSASCNRRASFRAERRYGSASRPATLH